MQKAKRNAEYLAKIDRGIDPICIFQEILKEKEYARLMKKNGRLPMSVVGRTKSVYSDQRQGLGKILRTLNDDLYAYCRELADIYRNEREDE